MDEFCENFAEICKRYSKNLTIPKYDPAIRVFAQEYLFNDNYNDDEFLFSEFNYTSKARTFIRDSEHPSFFLKCYSDNLHLYQSRSKLETRELDYRTGYESPVSYYTLVLENTELFYPMDGAVFVGIHSPYTPIDFMKLHPIQAGIRYLIDVQLEREEYLLPSPYHTECKDNGPSEDAKEFTNSNSFQMCLDLCSSKYLKAYRGCDRGLKMVSSPDDLCVISVRAPLVSEYEILQFEKRREICLQDCKPGCLKLQYNYRIKETVKDVLPFRMLSSEIYLYVKNPEVTELRHVPLYGSSEIFSHVGGLLGCWLGISVFTFTDILEKFFRKVIGWKQGFRK